MAAHGFLAHHRGTGPFRGRGRQVNRPLGDTSAASAQTRDGPEKNEVVVAATMFRGSRAPGRLTALVRAGGARHAHRLHRGQPSSPPARTMSPTGLPYLGDRLASAWSARTLRLRHAGFRAHQHRHRDPAARSTRAFNETRQATLSATPLHPRARSPRPDPRRARAPGPLDQTWSAQLARARAREGLHPR